MSGIPYDSSTKRLYVFRGGGGGIEYKYCILTKIKQVMSGVYINEVKKWSSQGRK